MFCSHFKYLTCKHIRYCSKNIEQISTKIKCIGETIREHNGKAKQRKKRTSHADKIENYFASEPHLDEIKQYIPDKYLKLKRPGSIENLYLIDTEISNRIVKYMLPYITKTQTICDTAPGLGLISLELLDGNFKYIRLYEPCPEYRFPLRDYLKYYPGRVELYVKDLFQLPRLSAIDRIDHSSRVTQLLKGIPRKEWSEAPAITIVGTMPKITFISYLMRMLALQSEIITHGRIQLFAIMRPCDYIKLSSGPGCRFHTYRSWSVLFNLFFEHELLDKYPRVAFLPWETKELKRMRYVKKVDPDQMYLVRINFKRKLPVDVYDLPALFYFVRQFFGHGNNKIIPTVEKWIPGCGLNFIVPSMFHVHYYKHLNIFTKFGELTPSEILSVFKEIISHPGYAGSSFAAMVQAELIKSETSESSCADHPGHPEMISDLEEKLNL